MVKRYGSALMAAILYLSFGIARSQQLLAEDMDLDPEYVVAQHIRSIGNPEDLAKIKSRGFGGTASFHFIQGATGRASNGQFLIVSEGRRLGIIMKYPDLEYPGEYFAFDGKEVTVGHIKPGQRSPLADFIYRYNDFMKEGFLGGALSSTWPLLEFQERKLKLRCAKKKIDGRRFYELEYRPTISAGESSIKMYFDTETFRHVRTEYKVRVVNDMSVQPSDAQIFDSVPDSHYLLIEKFDDFRDEGGLMLPHTYTMDYSIDGQGGSFLAHWAMAINQRAYNGTIDPSTFRAQK